MSKPASGPDGDEPALSPIYEFEAISPERRQALAELAGPHQQLKAVADSDMESTGQYGRSHLVLGDREIVVEERGEEARRLPLDNIVSAACRDFVGNGLLELRTKDGHKVELIRYSKRMADSFHEIAQRINDQVGVGVADLEAQEEEAAKTSGPKESSGAYRCPNCGHPLRFASDACPKCTSAQEVVFRLVKLMRNHWRLASLGVMLSVAITVVNLGPGFLIKLLVDKALSPPRGTEMPLAERQSYLLVIVLVFVGLVAIRAVVSHWRIKVMGNLGQCVVLELRRQLYRTLQRLSLAYYDREHTGRIMSRVLADTQAVQRFVVEGIQQLLINALMVVGISLMLFVIDWRLAALALCPVPVVALCARVFSRQFRSIHRSVRRKLANLSAAVAEGISGIRVVKSFSQEDREIGEFEGKLQDLYSARMRAVRTKARFNPTVAFMMSVGTIIVWYVGGRMVMDQQGQPANAGAPFTLGALMLFIGYMGRFYAPVQQLLNLTESFQSTATAAERIFNLMDMPSEVADHGKAKALGQVRGHIQLQDVSFGYDEGERVLKHVSLEIAPGEMIGLVGETGSGKSTLISLVCRFYDPTDGVVRLDGTDLRDVKVKSLRDRIGMVLQESFLFAGTIRDNIAYGRPQATAEEILQAAKAANAHDFIMNLPDGYDTLVGERGVGLSGGEKQRISIARAILKDPAILILDEATSAVDTATEASIQEAMDRLVKGRTTIAIAHRLSTLRNANRLLVLERGEIIEQGTHEALMEADGTYANLCKIQMSFGAELAAGTEAGGPDKG